MKLYHFSIIFVIISLSLIVILDVKINNFIAVVEEKENLDNCFHNAIDDAVVHLVEVEGTTGLKDNRERAVEDFFLSMYASLNIVNNLQKQALIKNYIPVITVTTEDGYYLYYSDEYKGSDNYTYISKRCSEKMPYYYEDDDFIYGFTLTDIITLYDKNGLLDSTKVQQIFTLDYHDIKNSEAYATFRSQKPNSFLLDDEQYNLTRKNSIISCIEKSMNYYCNRHNSIARQYGITYNFAMPVIDNSEWIRSIDNPGMIVVFQGYPFGKGLNETYNRFAVAGARIKKNTVYYLEQKDWYYIYHKKGCPELKKEGIIFSTEPYYTVLDCVDKGAYACRECIDNGVYAPEYDVK